MLSKRASYVAVLVVAGAVSLTSCGLPTFAAGPAPAAPSAQVPETGSASLSLLAGTAKAHNATAKTGDWATGSDGTANTADQNVARKWVQLKASQAGALDPVVVNGAGLTLYRFDKDTAKPSMSNCNGDCAKTWPPLTVAPGGRIFLAGVPKSKVGTVKRDDGSLQVTIGGWPVYRFAKDTKPGDAKGQGVGGTWFGITPSGQKAGAVTGDGNGDAQDGSTQPTESADSAVLFDDPNFSDDGASQGVAGPGCKNVARPDVTSSISASGSLKLWSGQNCTGKSLVINGDVADLGEVGFDNAVESVFFG